jgi:hypothetical protein
MMLSIKTLAIMLLIGHFGSVFFISFVIKRQLGLFRIPTVKALRHFRRTLFYLSMGIFLGNMIPITIDALTLFVNTGRPQHVRGISIAYAMSNAIIELLSAYLVWKLYKLASDTKDITDFEASQVGKGI